MQVLRVFFLAARNNGDWTENIFFIVLVVVWIIGAIVKGLSKKSVVKQPVGQEFEKKPSKPVKPVRLKTIVQSPSMQPVVQKKAQEEKSHISDKSIRIPAYGELIALDFASEIRKAVVYSEILGKPLSLRDYPFYE